MATRIASATTAGVYTRAKRSTRVCAGARCACARSTRWMIRASVVSRRTRVTRTSRAPRPLMVPANTSSPGALSTGIDSPVTGAWLTALCPDDNRAVERNLLARLDHDQRARGDLLDADPTLDPPGRGPAPPPASDSISARTAFRARSSVRASSICATANRNDHRRRLGPLAENDRASGGDSMRTLMSSDAARMAFQALRAVTVAPAADRHGIKRRARARASGRMSPARSATANANAAVHTRIRRRLEALSATTIGSSCSSQARMPASATAPAIAEAGSFAASYFTSSRCPITSALNVFDAAQMLEPSLDQGHLFTAVHPFDLEGRLGMDLADRTGGGHQLTSQTAARTLLARMTEPNHRVTSSSGRVVRCRPSARAPFLDVLEPLLEEANDVLIVEGVEHHSALPAGTNEPHAAKQTQLVGDGRFAQAEQTRDIADAELRPGERIKYANAGGIAEELNVSASAPTEPRRGVAS